jgi:hypothetical protein
MRSRAVNHLGRERDYVLYLALWSAACGERSDPRVPIQPDIALLSTSDMLASLHIAAPRTSCLYVSFCVGLRHSVPAMLRRPLSCRESYRKLLPAWTFSAARVGEASSGQVPGAAVYDPYELESARTKDLYWNEIQKLFVEQQYLHPLLIVYWAYRVLTWSVSSRAAIAVSAGSRILCSTGWFVFPNTVLCVESPRTDNRIACFSVCHRIEKLSGCCIYRVEAAISPRIKQ